MTEPSHAVFLSYASQDAEAAQRICEALRAAGIEVWFDQSALRGGDVWDQTIRKQIKTCVLFIPVISGHTHERDEGYFRLEWKLAVDRSHLMTTNKAFLLPVVIDDTREDDENVPDRFRDIHWTRLPGGEPPPAFVERVRRLVSPEASHGPTTTALPAAPGSAATPLTREQVATPRRSRQALPKLLAVVVAGLLAYFGIDKFWFSKYQPSPPTAPTSAAPAAFAPPPHSIAVLPFVNMSGDKEQEYFSDGLTEELLDSLSRINELQVAARTSAFSFKGKDTDIATIARRLNVAAVLEGSVRRSAQTVRVTTQLINSVTGFHVWSQTYDRDLGDVLKLQTDIATAVASALKVTLLGDVAAKVEVGGTRNPAAFDAYLRASKAYREYQNKEVLQSAIAGYTEAIELDPGYALAYAERSLALATFGRNETTSPGARRDYLNKAQLDANKATALAPDLALGHLALAELFESSLDFLRANQKYERALALEPGNATLLRYYSWFAVLMGHTEPGLAAARRAVALDPLNSENHSSLGGALVLARRPRDAIAVFADAKALTPNDAWSTSWLGAAYRAIGDFESARAACESVQPANYFNRVFCLAITYDKLGRHAEAETMLAQARASAGDEGAVFYAEVFAQWGDATRALGWLQTAMRQQDPYLKYVKVNPLFDPLRKEPRFQTIERELKFPN